VTRLRRATGRTFAALQVRNFRLYFVGQLISISGTWLQSFAQGFLVVQILRASAIDLGITIALPFLPMLLFGPLGGVVVDRSNKRHILYATQTAAGLLALTLGVLVSTHHVSLTAIWVVGALLGVVNLFDNPARQSFVQEMVGRELIPNAVSLNSAMINLGRVLGPAIGAALLFVGIAACFYVNAASFLALLVALALMRTDEITRIRTVVRAKGQVRAGLRYAWDDHELREVLASVVLGGLLGGLYVAHRARPTRRLLAVLALAFGLLMAALALAPTVAIACLAIVPMGAASLAFVSTANASLQLHSKEEMRGRVMSLYAMGFLGTTPIGAVLAGLIAEATDARVAIAVGAAANLLASAYLVTTARARAASRIAAAPSAA